MRSAARYFIIELPPPMRKSFERPYWVCRQKDGQRLASFSSRDRAENYIRITEGR